jgi:ABC-type glycerol-3-phosphate transport system permease component
MANDVQKTNLRRRVDFGDIVVQISLLTLGILISLPIFIALFTSFKVPSQVVTFPPQLIPREWTLENYRIAFETTPFGRYIFNSVVQSSVITAMQVIFSVLAAYAFSILEFPGRDTLFYLVLGSLMVPFELVFIPNFVLVSNLGWANTYIGLTAPFLVSAFGVFLLRQFFLTVPKEYRDSSKIDGAGNWRFLWQILVPLSKGSIGAFAIFAFLSAWNQYLWPLIITSSQEMRTLQIGIRFFMSQNDQGSDWGAVMAGSMIAIVPALIVFLLAQKQLVRGITMSGLKG